MEPSITIRRGSRYFALIFIWPVCFLWFLRDLVLTKDPQVMFDVTVFLLCAACLALHYFLIRRPRLILQEDMLCYRTMFSGWELAKYRIASATVKKHRSGNKIVLTDRTSGKGFAFPAPLFRDAQVDAWFSTLPGTTYTDLKASLD